MGVPTFYRWLCARFPKVVKDAVEETEVLDRETGSFIPADLSSPNPNGEIDCLYLDMNGIIHPCCHPEDAENPGSEDEMYRSIFLYIDRIFSIVRPRKLLYMAIDGVAPRAKMNQQRQRRFKAAAEMEMEERNYSEIKTQFEKDGRVCPPPKSHWDSNVITPGTPFMDRLSKALRFYVNERMALEPAWTNIKVILSDANSPGEGEHKIMQFIRNQRSQPDHDPNLRHCLHGADADLIMLGLATHEARFWIMREVVTTDSGSSKKCRICGRTTHYTDQCEGEPLTEEEMKDKTAEEQAKAASIMEAKAKGVKASWKPLQFLQLNILREYLAFVFKFEHMKIPFKYDFERCVDDFVFMCFFVGNDFLPHLPSLSIHKGSIDQMVLLYQHKLPELGDYLTNEGEVNGEATSKFIKYLSLVETAVFQDELMKKNRNKDKQAHERVVQERFEKEARERNALENQTTGMQGQVPEISRVHYKSQPPLLNDPVVNALKETKFTPDMAYADTASVLTGWLRSREPANILPSEANEDTAQMLRNEIFAVSPNSSKRKRLDAEIRAPSPTCNQPAREIKDVADGEIESTSPKRSKNELGSALPRLGTTEAERKREDVDDFKAEMQRRMKSETEIEGDPVDDIKLGVGDRNTWRTRYYKTKFHLEDNDDTEQFATRVAAAYVEGMCWVLKYYYQGVASWGWFYPFHYAPFASDIISFHTFSQEVSFALGEPFKPFNQLMAVFPARSGHCLPLAFRQLMTDPTSPILDFYPTKFKEDPDGKKYKWQWVVLLPFIDVERLLRTTATVESHLNEEETRRNGLGVEFIFMSKQHPLSSVACNACEDSGGGLRRLAGLGSEGCLGSVRRCASTTTPGSYLAACVDGCNALTTSAFTLEYVSPPKVPHKCQILPGVVLGEAELTMDDLGVVGTQDKGFNVGVAKRLIRGALGVGGGRRGGFEGSRGFGRGSAQGDLAVRDQYQTIRHDQAHRFVNVALPAGQSNSNFHALPSSAHERLNYRPNDYQQGSLAYYASHDSSASQGGNLQAFSEQGTWRADRHRGVRHVYDNQVQPHRDVGKSPGQFYGHRPR